MHDIRWIREQPGAFDAALARRGLGAGSGAVLALDGRHRATVKDLQELQARRNELSKAVGAAKQKGIDAGEIIAEVGRLKDRLQALEDEERALGRELEELLAGYPNAPADDVPDGPDERANAVLREVGQKPAFDFAPRQHFELGEGMGLMDFETAARIAGARFVVLTGALARLERALAAFMLDIHTKELGYTEVSPPVLVRGAALYGTGQLPKFSEDLFRTSKPDWVRIGDWVQNKLNQEINSIIDIRPPKEDFSEDLERLNRRAVQLYQEAGERREFEERMWLIPTAEVPLTNLVRERILDAADLPLRVTALTPCFRAEAGAAGKDTRGMLRQHQFNKVELVSITAPEDSEAEHERMTACAEKILERLGLAYRVVVLSTGDMGFAARKTYDIEVWLPGQGTYREISSCSNCGDFQARRMNARFRPKGEKGTRFVHTLNGSGLAVGRTLIALLENCQRADGSVAIPDTLREYMSGADAIGGGA